MSVELHFDVPFSFEKSIHIIRALIETLNCSPRVTGLINYGSYEEILAFTMDYDLYDDPLQVIDDRQALAFFQKNESLPIAVDREQAALKKFFEAEERCRITNGLLRRPDRTFQERMSRESLIFELSRKIDHVLGDAPDFCDLPFGFGPGSNVGITRLTSVRRKLSAVPTLTTNAFLCGVLLRRDCCPHWDYLEKLKFVPGGKLAFVRKNALTDRIIVIEPIINTFVQKGIGKVIRERLREHGCDLNSQARNQKLARKGSIDGSLATIDLASASDTIAKALVERVFNDEWYALLCASRTPTIKLPKSKEYLAVQKFSSMGNGYTFELESLIFFCLIWAVTGRKPSVYGDDIIVPTGDAEQVIAALELLGFEVNTKKSFVSGPFRESCGGDYFRGVSVRPCYVKGNLSVKELFRLHNFFVREGYPERAEVLIKYIPKRLRIFGPDGYGDGHLLGDFCPTWSRKQGHAGYMFRTLSRKPLSLKGMLRGDYPAWLYYSTTVGLTAAGPGRNNLEVTFGNPRFTWEPTSSLFSEAIYQERDERIGQYRHTRVYVLS